MKSIKKSQKLYKRAKKIIPGGNMLLSKKPELFLPDGWPAYYLKTKGCEIWDLDHNKFFDLSVDPSFTTIISIEKFNFFKSEILLRTLITVFSSLKTGTIIEARIDLFSVIYNVQYIIVLIKSSISTRSYQIKYFIF